MIDYSLGDLENVLKAFNPVCIELGLGELMHCKGEEERYDYISSEAAPFMALRPVHMPDGVMISIDFPDGPYSSRIYFGDDYMDDSETFLREVVETAKNLGFLKLGSIGI
jgi:hypothetical protein